MRFFVSVMCLLVSSCVFATSAGSTCSEVFLSLNGLLKNRQGFVFDAAANTNLGDFLTRATARRDLLEKHSRLDSVAAPAQEIHNVADGRALTYVTHDELARANDRDLNASRAVVARLEALRDRIGKVEENQDPEMKSFHTADMRDVVGFLNGLSEGGTGGRVMTASSRLARVAERTTDLASFGIFGATAIATVAGTATLGYRGSGETVGGIVGGVLGLIPGLPLGFGIGTATEVLMNTATGALNARGQRVAPRALSAQPWKASLSPEIHATLEAMRNAIRSIDNPGVETDGYFLPQRDFYVGLNTKSGHHVDVLLRVTKDGAHRGVDLSVFQWQQDPSYWPKVNIREQFAKGIDGSNAAQSAPVLPTSLQIGQRLRDRMDLIPADRLYNPIADAFARADKLKGGLSPVEIQRLQEAADNFANVGIEGVEDLIAQMAASRPAN